MNADQLKKRAEDIESSIAQTSQQLFVLHGQKVEVQHHLAQVLADEEEAKKNKLGKTKSNAV